MWLTWPTITAGLFRIWRLIEVLIAFASSSFGFLVFTIIHSIGLFHTPSQDEEQDQETSIEPDFDSFVEKDIVAEFKWHMYAAGSDFNPWNDLGLWPNATKKEIRSARNRIIKRCHSDKNDRRETKPEADTLVQRAIEAAIILSNEDLALRYDIAFAGLMNCVGPLQLEAALARACNADFAGATDVDFIQDQPENLFTIVSRCLVLYCQYRFFSWCRDLLVATIRLLFRCLSRRWQARQRFRRSPGKRVTWIKTRAVDNAAEE